ncbi:hypothetical protein [Dactylosporangium matsuzakiense]|uniref:MFS transporter n=1 Tax=Dactylosporangium matsuzakiense TaxID=53360 RepID=A0A9W6KTC1_9ACTN|nr:hypothetical protein [Dactylosporangium matsuzakiense]UWZ42597.1 hypothetical protein Dmats_34255 [Dactylosporangium matsuzakiense]GLL06156.1 hypothetical protein GCM10017581_079040 [Dactylosporangium matsuzakiense]
MAGVLAATASEPPPGGPSRGLLVDRRLLHRRFVALFAANLALGCFFGGIGVAVTAFALAHRAGALAGPIMAVAGAAAVGGGVGRFGWAPEFLLLTALLPGTLLAAYPLLRDVRSGPGRSSA